MQHLMTEAAAEMTAVVRAVKPDQLALPTPCTEYDVRTLVNHLIYWSGFFSEAAAGKQLPPEGAQRDYTDGDWAEIFAEQSGRAAATWAKPGAWEGVSQLAGTPMPASVVGSLLLAELVLHGWDLAVATGVRPAYSDEVAQATLGILRQAADQGRAAGIFAEPVPVPVSAPPLDQALGLSGRDPRWKAPLPS
ncbi:MAG TPA: TIGR03086 family metal-binding protein [Micromonospora sp.]|nr:TIGR03086 family metal-binding protein [Micromonospora sp.]